MEENSCECLLCIMNKKWEDHILWTRFVIISYIYNNPDIKANEARLIRNQREIGELFGKFYDKEVEENVFNLLKDHILIAGKLIKYAKNKNKSSFEMEHKKWYENSKSFSLYLSKLNDSWEYKKIKEYFDLHLDQTLKEVTYLLDKEFDKSIKEYDDIKDHILKMSCYLYKGLINKFPEDI